MIISDRSMGMAFFFFISLFTAVFLMGLTGCSDPSAHTEPNIEVIQDMMEQPAIKAQDFDPHNREQSGMRLPPAGATAQNREVYLYKGNAAEAAAKLVNPYKNPSEEILKLGKKHFSNYCFVCHGPGGQGDGPVASKFQGVKPPSIMSDKIRGVTDGAIFHIITEGQGVMGSYINQMPFAKDRWAVVAYVRQLQKETK
jgi:mono/diheme cytochrome c family protein